MILRSKMFWRYLGIALAAVVSAGLVFSSGEPHQANRWGTQPATAQSIRADDVWRQVYQQLPDFPKENQYINADTRQVASDNTLIGRLIRYHLYVKGRSPLYRLDWKLTLADYLGVNETIKEDFYPSRSKFRTSPMAGDLAAIQKLNRAQREALVQALITAFSPPAASVAPASAPQPSSISSPAPAPTPAAKPARGPGAAQLLRP